MNSILKAMAIASVMSLGTSAQSAALEIHIDADFTINFEAGEAIELGVATALEENGWQLGGEPVEIVRRDHRGNVKRSRANLERFLGNENAVTVIGGMHSPPYLVNREFINENELLLMLPWSAAGPITRAAENMANWIFRLSVDDSKTGEFMVQQSIDQGNCQSLALILLETGWGRANEVTLTAALKSRGMHPAFVEYFAASIGRAGARSLADRVEKSGADCAVMLSSWDNGAIVVNALGELDAPPRLFSHWGIMGGPFSTEVSHETRQHVNLQILQTCGLARETPDNTVLQNVLDRVEGNPNRLSDIPAPTGFIHGYDLTRVLIAAAEQASQLPEWQDGITARRGAIRAALQDLDRPVSGILKTYDAPYAPYSAEAPDAHEALGTADLCMARFNSEGNLENID